MFGKIRENTRRHRPLRLSNAMVCINCEHVFNGSMRIQDCPVCTSSKVIPLATWVPHPRAMAAMAGRATL